MRPWAAFLRNAMLGLVLHAAAGAATAPLMRLAWLDAQGEAHAVLLDRNGIARGDFEVGRPVPLGSLWTLVAYAQWVESAVPEKPLQCTGRAREEGACCERGEIITRGPALAKSCGLYFSRERVPWSARPGPAMRELPASIAHAVRNGTLGPETTVSPRDWLHWLAAWPPALRERASNDLLRYWVQGTGRRALGQVGARLRVKPYTLVQADGQRVAGASGWNADDTPIWFASAGTGADVVPDRALHVLAAVRGAGQGDAADLSVQEGQACVRVNFFARSPVTAIEALGQGAPAADGPLQGRYRLTFENGRQLDIESAGELVLSGTPGDWTINAVLPLEDYVARVIDREGSAQPVQAAWALAVAARSHVLAHGRPSQGCVEIDDSTAAQRVSPRPATMGAREAARGTRGLVLAGGYPVTGMTHESQARDGVLSWRRAGEQAGKGANFLAILQTAYPRATLATAGSHGALACEPMVGVQAWFERERPRWNRLLAGQPGYADPGAVQLCKLAGGRAHAQSGNKRIDVAGFATLEERLALAHEYVHVAFARHPRGRDERFVEAQARRLLGVQP